MNDDERKYLEMIQAAISRMAAHSFMLKGWSVTAATALIAFASGTKHHWIAVVGLLPTMVFWALDGYYLAEERRFRALFRDAARVTPPKGQLSERPLDNYDMDVRRYNSRHPWWRAALSKSVCLVHGIAALTVIVVAGAVSTFPKQDEDDPVRVQVRDTIIVRTPGSPPPGGVGR